MLVGEMKKMTRGDVGIVVSSSWRIGYSTGGLRELFGQYRFSESVIGSTLELESRSSEICSWIQKEGSRNLVGYLILDDVDCGFSELFPEQFVECDELFNERLYKKALSLLKVQLEKNDRDPGAKGLVVPGAQND
eukprot:TRINITY_DN21401_c0_g1_i1.p1 TRINITY_DN21401_c0_g1~~TRINITY_DN21401_c0_g1_i1.p1  ORF type:complete len:135 (+),score=44.53 TRINITY_DN21401_c0_g1_i1:293-697(+)